MKISAQDDTILRILDFLDDTPDGQILQSKCFIEYELNEPKSFIFFLRKDCKPMHRGDVVLLNSLVKEPVL